MNARTDLLTYTEVRDRQKTSGLRQAEVPVEHYISLPMPTNRAPVPTYAFFAAAAIRRAGSPHRQASPDRWWLVDARSGRTILYSLERVHSFAGGTEWPTVDIPPPTVGLDELRRNLRGIEEKLNALAPAFFRGEAGDAAERRELAEALEQHIPDPIQPQYRALAPDFFAWLES